VHLVDETQSTGLSALILRACKTWSIPMSASAAISSGNFLNVAATYSPNFLYSSSILLYFEALYQMSSNFFTVVKMLEISICYFG
jgi:hypothetical protein